MTRRILFMLLAFTAIVLVGAVVPLTLNATMHDRTSFIQAAEGMARTDAVRRPGRAGLGRQCRRAEAHQSFGQRDRAGQFLPAHDGQGGAAGR